MSLLDDNTTIEAGAGFQVQVGVLRVGDQQAAAFQHPYDAEGEGVEQATQNIYR